MSNKKAFLSKAQHLHSVLITESVEVNIKTKFYNLILTWLIFSDLDLQMADLLSKVPIKCNKVKLTDDIFFNLTLTWSWNDLPVKRLSVEYKHYKGKKRLVSPWPNDLDYRASPGCFADVSAYKIWSSQLTSWKPYSLDRKTRYTRINTNTRRLTTLEILPVRKYAECSKEHIRELLHSIANHGDSYVKIRIIFANDCVFICVYNIVTCVLRNKAIADYLSSNGYHQALQQFQKEADMVS